MTHCGMGRSLSDSRMVPSAGVAEPHREFWLPTHRTAEGRDRPPRYLADSCAAWAARASSVAGRRRPDAARRSPCLCSFSSMRWTHSRSCAAVNRAGMATTAVPSSQNAATVRVRRADRRTSTGEPSAVAKAAAGWGAARRAGACRELLLGLRLTGRSFQPVPGGRLPRTSPAWRDPRRRAPTAPPATPAAPRLWP